MTAVRLLRVPLSIGCSPAAALRALREDSLSFALVGRWAGSGAIVGSSPVRVAAPGDDPFDLLDELPRVEGETNADAVGGGWFGWLGYGLGARVETLPPPPPRPVPLPPFQLAYYDHLLRLDAEGRWWFEALATPARESALHARLALLSERLAAVLGPRPTDDAEHRAPAPSVNGDANTHRAPPRFRIAGGGAVAHLAAVRECRERIAAGEIFQANVCLRFEAAWDGDVAELFATASERLQPAYGAAFPTPWGGIASLSPELFLRRRGGAVETAPIKGTIARDATPDSDAGTIARDATPDSDAARAALVASKKDHAEHVMIVDLMRNDLGRVSRYGTVEAARTPEAQAHPGLWHLVSRVRGELRPEVGDGELLRATFPPGSVTGAPKVQALHVISELEGTARELYTGAVGFASPIAGLELNVAIRTFEARDGRLWLGAGGGIVADSDPLAELEECHVKARPLIAAIGGVLDEAPPAETSHVSSLLALTPTRRRPDPALGVFETLLVSDRVALRAEAHLARLSASTRVLYGRPLPARLAKQVDEAAAGAGPGQWRLRVALIVDDKGEPAAELSSGPLPTRSLPIALAPVTLPGGLGAHKWLDRRLLDALALELRATALLLDADDTVLEAAWGSVFVVEGTRLVTPPADGRILSGVTRAALLQRAADAGLRPSEEPLTVARLHAADALLITSALGLALPATLSAEPQSDGTLAVRIARRLHTLLLAADSPAATPA
ncbi:MAG TPA: chorismate-binding protein [Conexibacter sp.]|jgi:para-aminobenzoate synthetase/4-amino-4-deoxychorismate lyase